MKENSECKFTEQGDINDSLQDEWNRSSERFDKERRLGNKSGSKISLSSSNIITTTQTISSIRSNGESLLIQSNAVWNTALSNLLHTSTNNGSNEDTVRVRHKNFELRRRYATPSFEQRKIAKINLNNNENFGSIWVDNSLRKVRNRIKRLINFLLWTWDLERMYIKMTDLRKLELRYQLRRFISLSERHVPIKIKYLASIIDKLNFLKVQVREALLYLQLMDSAKMRALKNREWKENMVLPKQTLQELYLSQEMIMRNQQMTLEVRIPMAVMVFDPSSEN
ncbi:MAG: hypothetical protein EZS28_034483 [Streblomastix strix]|uniref:Uncharacterized protein n=1 Tax=Streblomastix strix TaxID=222440 RepID=A0A5J4UJ31_9EUKA|nr:MAG: hypothetical protein EZS28_034483 [Streblomastix strix]